MAMTNHMKLLVEMLLLITPQAPPHKPSQYRGDNKFLIAGEA